MGLVLTTTAPSCPPLWEPAAPGLPGMACLPEIVGPGGGGSGLVTGASTRGVIPPPGRGDQALKGSGEGGSVYLPQVSSVRR